MLGIKESGTPPVGSNDPVLQIRLGVAALAGEDRSTWTGVAKSERLIELLDTRERLDAEILRATGEWDRDRAWEIDGSLSPRAWLAHRTPLADGDAGRLVKHGRLLEQHERIGQRRTRRRLGNRQRPRPDLLRRCLR